MGIDILEDLSNWAFDGMIIDLSPNLFIEQHLVCHFQKSFKLEIEWIYPISIAKIIHLRVVSPACVLFVLQQNVVGKAWMEFMVLIDFVFGWWLYGWAEIVPTSNLVLFDGFFLDTLMVGAVAIEGFADLVSIIEWWDDLEITMIFCHHRQPILHTFISPFSFTSPKQAFLELAYWEWGLF